MTLAETLSHADWSKIWRVAPSRTTSAPTSSASWEMALAGSAAFTEQGRRLETRGPERSTHRLGESFATLFDVALHDGLVAFILGVLLCQGMPALRAEGVEEPRGTSITVVTVTRPSLPIR